MKIMTRKEAASKGLKHYFDGKPCKRGHLSLRASAGGPCIECGRILSKQYTFAKKRNGGSHTKEQIEFLRHKQKNRCANCFMGFDHRGYDKDHIVPITKGGGSNISNIQLLCLHCNLKKHNKDPFDFARENGRLL